MKKIGMIGFGKFGRAFYEHIIRGPALVYDQGPKCMADILREQQNFPGLGAKLGSLEEVAVSDVIFVSVPTNSLEELHCSLVGKVKKGALIVDCSSVQCLPQALARKYLAAAKCAFVSMHCLFGPQSLSQGLRPLRAVLNTLWGRGQVGWLLDFLSEREVNIKPSSAKDHDKAMAISMATSHVLVRALLKIGAGQVAEEYHTGSFALLYRMMSILKDDLPEPYNTIVGGNPYSKDALDRLLEELIDLRKQMP